MIVRGVRGVCRWYIRLIQWLTPAVPRQRELASSRGPMARAVPRHARVAAGATAERADEVEELEVEVKPLPLGLGVRASLHDWHTWLVQPVHASSLGLFRVVFSICMYMQATHFNYIFEDFMTSKGVYPYPGLGWVRPPPPEVGNMLLRLNKVAAVLTCLGLCTRTATVVLFVTFTWVFLLCESNHNNHYILICHATFLASLTSWGCVRACPSRDPRGSVT